MPAVDRETAPLRILAGALIHLRLYLLVVELLGGPHPVETVEEPIPLPIIDHLHGRERVAALHVCRIFLDHILVDLRPRLRSAVQPNLLYLQHPHPLFLAHPLTLR